MDKVFSTLLVVLLAAALPSECRAQTKIVTDGSGSHLEAGGGRIFVKGFTWSCTPIGRKYDYNLFAEPEDVIKAAIERDMGLMRAMGANAIRGNPPPEWVAYIYRNYGIYTIINPFCGRYGLTINGNWTFPTDYSDPATRKIILDECRAAAEKYRNTEGVLLFAFGNENNYGLEWKSTEIENLPQGERHRVKARVLYGLYEEIFKEVKKIDPGHPGGLVNGDLQYLDLIAELCPSMDYLGVNAYRGGSAGPLYEEVKAKLGKPVLYMEIGVDAFNAKENREDQLNQALFLKKQWLDIYGHAYGSGKIGNCLGAVVFQWSDEWWKKGQESNLTVHDTEGSWTHDAYHFDAGPGIKNMNEEWFGICAITNKKANGVHAIIPRAGYFALKKIWAKDPLGLGADQTAQLFAAIDPAAEEKTALEEAARRNLDFKNVFDEKQAALAAVKKAALPFSIYRDAGDEANTHFVPSGYMGDYGDIKMNANSAENPQEGKTCIKVEYSGQKAQGRGWAGVYWQEPSNNWGEQDGGYDLSSAKKFVFRARGVQGGETVEFMVGGVPGKNGKKGNTAEAKLGKAALTKDWTEYTISLEGKNFSNIIFGFGFVVAGGAKTFYIDNMRYE